jgi:lipid II:glycine glycyltransferase (peptidoglycan interpeptide bridge formation enzyme)
MALKAELKLTQGKLREIIHNTEAARYKAEQAREKYERSLDESPDERLKDEIKRVRKDRDYWKREYGKLHDAAFDATRLLTKPDKWKLVEEWKQVEDDG